MIGTHLDTLRTEVETEYTHRTPQSRAINDYARAYLPGGDTRSLMAFAPYPTYVDHSAGSYLYDVDGNVLLDFLNNKSVLIHGHAHPTIVEAIQRQAALGSVWAAFNAGQVELARIICERTPSIERVRFCNSGTEACMQMIKAARAFTGRDKVLKMDGAYHGSSDGVEFDSLAHVTGDPADAERAAAYVRGVPVNAADNVLIAPFNDADTVERLIAAHRDELAAVIVNPVQTRPALTAATPEFLTRLRTATRACGVLLLFDEVVSYRVSAGGAQEYYAVIPDLTALGKFIGGGLPIGAFGGCADIMQQYVDGEPPTISHPGSFNGNPLSMAAGIAAMNLLTPAAYAHLGEIGELLVQRLRATVDELGIEFEIAGIKSMVSLTLPKAAEGDPAAAQILHLLRLALLNRGFNTASFFAMSTVHTRAEVEQLDGAVREILGGFRLTIEESARSLLKASMGSHRVLIA